MVAPARYTTAMAASGAEPPKAHTATMGQAQWPRLSSRFRPLKRQFAGLLPRRASDLLEDRADASSDPSDRSGAAA